MAFSVRCAVPLREPRSRVFTYSLLQPAELGLCSPEQLRRTAAHALCNFTRISRPLWASVSSPRRGHSAAAVPGSPGAFPELTRVNRSARRDAWCGWGWRSEHFSNRSTGFHEELRAGTEVSDRCAFSFPHKESETQSQSDVPEAT